jgi:hypothetical protein
MRQAAKGLPSPKPKNLRDTLPRLPTIPDWNEQSDPGDRVVLTQWQFVCLLSLTNPEKWPDLTGEYGLDGREVEVVE